MHINSKVNICKLIKRLNSETVKRISGHGMPWSDEKRTLFRTLKHA